MTGAAVPTIQQFLGHEKHPKSWFRAYFNWGLINYIKGKPRLLPCEAGLVNFFVDPYHSINLLKLPQTSV